MESGKPMIVTTNLSPQNIGKTDDAALLNPPRGIECATVQKRALGDADDLLKSLWDAMQ